MGNTTSYLQKGGNKKLDDALDYIATYYILTMDFKSLTQLYKMEYCNELLVLTSDIINRYFSDMDILRASDRIEHGAEKERVLFLKKSDVDHLYDINPERKTMICKNIAKYYIKIAHLFAAILMTINPEYIYRDESGRIIRKKLSEKSEIPQEAQIDTVKANLCDSRVDALRGDSQLDFDAMDKAKEQETQMEIAPKICSTDIYAHRLSSGGDSLDDIVGIPELVDLYMDDDYDYETGDFKGMTAETKQQYDQDLKRFYSVFTGNETMPESVVRFSDIKIKDYGKSKICQGEHPLFDKKLTGNYKDELFYKYAENLRNMMTRVNEKQDQLLKVINKLFVYVKDPEDAKQTVDAKQTEDGKQVIRINPELTDEILQSVIAETRSTIVELYLGCETDFEEGVSIYEAIVEAKILETSQNQIATMKSEIVKLINPFAAKIDA